MLILQSKIRHYDKKYILHDTVDTCYGVEGLLLISVFFGGLLSWQRLNSMVDIWVGVIVIIIII